jgi:single stranded DNA-binding protein
MNQLNSIIIEGNLAQEPELTKTPSGMEVCNLPIAVNRFHKNSNGEEINEVSFFDIQGHGKLAEVLSQTKKGQGIRVIAEHAEIRPFREVKQETKKNMDYDVER